MPRVLISIFTSNNFSLFHQNFKSNSSGYICCSLNLKITNYKKTYLFQRKLFQEITNIKHNKNKLYKPSDVLSRQFKKKKEKCIQQWKTR